VLDAQRAPPPQRPRAQDRRQRLRVVCQPRLRWDRDHGISTGPQLDLLHLYSCLARAATTYLRVQLLY
jgi:hypothetical protein